MYTSTISDQTDRRTLTHYDDTDPLAGIPSRNDIVAEYDNGMTTILQQFLSNKQTVHFMPTAVSDEAEYINGVSTYILRVSGCLINEQKAIVNVMDIKPFFDVVVPEEIPLSMFKTKLVKILSNILGSTSKFGIETISAFLLQGYHTKKKLYIHVRTWNHFDRHKVLKAVREVGISTASDDLNPTYYYRKVACEERLPLSSWAVLRGTYLFQLSVNNYNPISEDDYNNPLFSLALSRDHTLILTWDIETYSLRRMGGAPNANFEENVIALDPQLITVICGSQTNLLKAFALCWKFLASDIHIGFNDSQYDWRFIVEKAKKLGVLEWMFNHMSFKPSSLEKITKWQYQYNMIKVNDGNFYLKHLKIPGCVAIDVWPCFMGLYSKFKKSSLAYYLRECNLDNKVDLPIHRINKYYEMALKETNVITAEQMQVVSISFLSLYDAHYFAGGMKVCNLLGASAWQRGLLTSTISCEQTESGSFLGAYVFPPIKGLENKCPVTGLDFASLYPSLIMTYNLSPDKIILSRERAEQSGKKLHEISFKFNNQDCLEWSIQHNNISEEKGLYANVLEYLSSLSLPGAIEQVLANTEEKKSASLSESLHHFINKGKHEFIAEYDSICFDCSCLDAKQYALKVYMNTFYGTAGDNKSPFFLRALAGGVTSAGQRNIKLVTDFVKSRDFQIKYGDTDSLYLVPPERCFQECDEAYDGGNGISKEEYWSRMVNISMGVMEKLHDEVNDFLRKDNKSSYLKMAYEEVIFPVVFTGKKKYYGIPHESKPNFNKELFIREIETVKRGQSGIFRKIGKRIMEESTRVNNTRTLHQVVEGVLKETVRNISQTDLNEIIKTAVWRPDKNNKSIQSTLRFISQMWDRHTHEEADAKRLIKKGLTSEAYLYEIPEPGKRHQPSSEIVLEALKKLKDGNKAGDNKADDGRMDEDDLDEDDLDEDKVDEDEVDEDEVSKIRDALSQKSAEKWVKGYIKNLHEGPKKDKPIITHLWEEVRIYTKNLFDTTYADKGEHLTNNAYYQSFLNALDKQEESICLKLSSLLKEISEVDIKYRDSMYKLVTKKRAMSLEQYLTLYYLDECKLLADF
ncbi:DNA/RNA polymerase [Rhizophagus irregularis]|nr:DNA/RNA polymerase [Rhizophagus irregularis]